MAGRTPARAGRPCGDATPAVARPRTGTRTRRNAPRTARPRQGNAAQRLALVASGHGLISPGRREAMTDRHVVYFCIVVAVIALAVVFVLN